MKIDSVLFNENDKEFLIHSNKRESREIALIFQRLSYAVDITEEIEIAIINVYKMEENIKKFINYKIE